MLLETDLIYTLASIRWSTWGIQAFHWFIHTFVGYLLMLAVMTYNVYINIALVAGGCIGYWVFGPKLVELKLARFHEKQRLLQCDKECAGNIPNTTEQTFWNFHSIRGEL